MPICLSRALQLEICARFRALFNAGSNIAARIAMIAITTRSSIRVKNLFLILISFAFVVPRKELLIVEISPSLEYIILGNGHFANIKFCRSNIKNCRMEKPE